jgi:hypothetical protein
VNGLHSAVQRIVVQAKPIAISKGKPIRLAMEAFCRQLMKTTRTGIRYSIENTCDFCHSPRFGTRVIVLLTVATSFV